MFQLNKSQLNVSSLMCMHAGLQSYGQLMFSMAGMKALVPAVYVQSHTN